MGRRRRALGCSLLLLAVALAPPAGVAQAGAAQAGESAATAPPATAPPTSAQPGARATTLSATPTANSTTEAASGATTPETAGDAAGGDGGPSLAPDSVVMRAEVAANGTATWRVEYRIRLDDPATTAAFRDLQRDVRTNAAVASEAFYDRLRASVESAEAATGREMDGSDFAVRATVREFPRAYGVVVYSFRWRGFAGVNEGRIIAGDALAGFFLDESERLEVAWPRGYELDDVRPPPEASRDRSVVWDGPTSFGGGEPHVALTETAWPGRSLVRVGAAVVAVALAGALAWRLRDRVSALSLPAGTRLGDDDRRELMSNEERVVDLLEERGGRVKQRDVAEALDWTETKTSYVISNLREEGRVHSFRLGRENVLSLSDPGEPERNRA